VGGGEASFGSVAGLMVIVQGGGRCCVNFKMFRVEVMLQCKIRLEKKGNTSKTKS